MGAFTVGEIVLVKFPFSDLTGFKLRPALIIISEKNSDLILCQITSKEYSDPNAIRIKPSDCLNGSLEMISFARPLKLFTANESIIEKKICNTEKIILDSLYNKLIELINKHRI